MKTLLFCCLLLFCLGSAPGLRGQGATSGEFRVTSRGAHSKTWERAVTEVRNGKTISRTERYTELATGMHVLRDGAWQETSDQLAVLPDQSAAVLTNAAYHAALPADLYHGALSVTTPDGARLSSRPLAIAYFDGTNSVQIAELKECTGELLPGGNQVLWPDAFTGLQADVLACCSRAGLQCDLVLRSQPPPPESFGLSPDSRLQLWTEFFEGSPQVRVEASGPAASTNSPGLTSGSSLATSLDAQVGAAGGGREGPQLPDVTLRFGQSQSMRMGLGKAFRIGPESPGTNTHRVFKSWNQLEGRTFLIEEIPLPAIRAELEKLHSSVARPTGETLLAAARSSPRAAGSKPPLPPARPPEKGTKTMLLAKADVSARAGFVLDYDLSGSVGDFTCTNSETYLVTDRFDVSGVLTLCGGAVIKLTNYTPARIAFSGPLRILADDFHPVVFTSMSDDSIGVTLPGSTHVPSMAGGACLEDWSNNANRYHHLRFCYPTCALSIPVQSYPNEIWHCQFLHCETAVAGGGGVLRFYNNLFSDCGQAIWGCDAYEVTQATFDRCGKLADAPWSFSSASLLNCILTGVTNVHLGVTLTNCVQAAAGAGIYQPAVAGAYYLATGSTNRASGSTNIHPLLRSDLRRLTTDPPVVLNQATVTADTTLGPQAQRDWAGAALGYHYAPLDFLLRGVSVTNAALRVLPGTALGSCGIYGLALRGGARFLCEGRAENPAHFARYNLVQEDSITNWDGKGSSLLGNVSNDESLIEITARFTDWSMPANDGDPFRAVANSPLAASFRDCHFHGGTFQFGDPAVTVTNCLFDGVSVTVWDNSYMSPVFHNCLFAGGSLDLQPFDGSTWTFLDNLFSGTLITQPNDMPVNALGNGYTPGTARLAPTNANDRVAEVVFQAGPAGACYLPTNSPFVDASGQLASAVGLYHFTTQIEQRKELDSTNDYSFHPVALAPPAAETVWVQDALPANATACQDSDPWAWTNSPAPASGSLCLRSGSGPGLHINSFENASPGLSPGPEDTLFCYLYLYGTNLPSEIMLQWLTTDSTSWDHRAFWGSDNITELGPRTCMGPLPVSGCWVRLEVPAREVDLVGRTVVGMAFTLYGGTAAWDYAGMMAGARVPVDTDGDGLSDVAEDLNGDGLYTPAIGETDWTTSEHGTTGVPGLQVFTPWR